MWFAVESRCRLCRQSVPQFDSPMYTAVFTDICSLFPGPNITIVIIPTPVACSFWPVPCFRARSPVYALSRAQMRAIFLRCDKVSKTKSLVWFANLAAFFCTQSEALSDRPCMGPSTKPNIQQSDALLTCRLNLINLMSCILATKFVA
jgi:hypothetical protein